MWECVCVLDPNESPGLCCGLRSASCRLKREWWCFSVNLSRDLSPVFLPSVPSAAPRNLTFELSDHRLVLSWTALQEEELQGALLAYKVQWTLGGEAQVS